MKIFYDCEFTHLLDHITPEKAELISIGLIAETGEHLYIENLDFDLGLCTYFVQDEVLPKLSWYPSVPYFTKEVAEEAKNKGGPNAMHAPELAAKIKAWIESFGCEVDLVSDATGSDYPLISKLFKKYGWPRNIDKQPSWLRLTMEQKNMYEEVLPCIYKVNPYLRHHHAGDDVKVVREAYRIASKERNVKASVPKV